MVRAIPDRAGIFPSVTSFLNQAVLLLCHVANRSARAIPSSGMPAASTKPGSRNRLAIRSLPPPIASRRAYSSSSQRTGRPYSSKVALKAGRWP